MCLYFNLPCFSVYLLVYSSWFGVALVPIYWEYMGRCLLFIFIVFYF